MQENHVQIPMKSVVKLTRKKVLGSHPLRIEHDPQEDLQEFDYEIFHAAIHKYEGQTWRMYDRIMGARLSKSHKNHLRTGCASTDRSSIVVTGYFLQSCSFECAINDANTTQSKHYDEGIFELDL
jgi:hypothetical protein